MQTAHRIVIAVSQAQVDDGIERSIAETNKINLQLFISTRNYAENILC